MVQEQDKTASFGVKAGIFGAFVAVWLGIGLVLRVILPGFKDGGWGMWPILAAALVFIGITIERVRYLFFRLRGNRLELMTEVQKHLMQGDVAGAIAVSRESDQPLARIVDAGLSNLRHSDEDVQEAVDEAALREMPRIEIRTGYLAMIGNIATLLGLLGTIIGLITSFAGVSLENSNDPGVQRRAVAYKHLVSACQNLSSKPLVECIKQNKATILAKGISEAMNCTAFGLLVGILSLLAFSVLNGRTQHLLDELSEGVVNLMNLAVLHRKAMKI